MPIANLTATNGASFSIGNWQLQFENDPAF
jgi:hypothetical protein